MALPTVHYFEAAAATDAMLISVFMPKLQELLFDAGWTIVFADSDAIGGGSSSVPAWDKTPAINQNAGIAVYRMPTNGHDTAWFVRIRPGWGASNVGRVYIPGVQLGTAHDGSGNVSGGGSESALVAHTANTAKDNGWAIAVSEDGFALLTDAANLVGVMLERARLLDGTVTDGLILVHQSASTVYAGRYVTAALGVVQTRLPVALVGIATGTTAPTPSLESNDATHVVVTGPYFPGGAPFFAPGRLAVTASPADVDAVSDRDINVDGGVKTYRSMNAAIANSGFRWLVATE